MTSSLQARSVQLVTWPERAQGSRCSISAVSIGRSKNNWRVAQSYRSSPTACEVISNRKALAMNRRVDMPCLAEAVRGIEDRRHGAFGDRSDCPDVPGHWHRLTRPDGRRHRPDRPSARKSPIRAAGAPVNRRLTGALQGLVLVDCGSCRKVPISWQAPARGRPRRSRTGCRVPTRRRGRGRLAARSHGSGSS
jgi:hypothetical protein